MQPEDGVGSTAGTPPRVPARALRLATSPNPFTGRTNIAFTLPARAPVEMGVYDVSGRLVCALVNAPLNAGAYSVAWDGHAMGGGRAAAGVYFVRLRAGDRRMEAKVVKMQ